MPQCHLQTCFLTYLHTILSCVATAGDTTARYSKHLHHSTGHEGQCPQVMSHASLQYLGGSGPCTQGASDQASRSQCPSEVDYSLYSGIKKQIQDKSYSASRKGTLIPSPTMRISGGGQRPTCTLRVTPHRQHIPHLPLSMASVLSIR